MYCLLGSIMCKASDCYYATAVTVSKPLTNCSVSSLGGGGNSFGNLHSLNKLCTSSADVSVLILV